MPPIEQNGAMLNADTLARALRAAGLSTVPTIDGAMGSEGSITRAIVALGGKFGIEHQGANLNADAVQRILASGNLAGSGGGGAQPVNLVAPQIVSNMVVGVSMSVVPGTYSGTVTSRSYQWLKGGVAISGATAATYTGVAGDAQGVITVAETASNGASAAAAVTSASVVCAPASAAYATALAAVADGQYFSVANNNASKIRIFQRLSGVGVLYDVTSLSGSVNAAAAAVRSVFASTAFPVAPLVDFDSTDAFYGEREYQSRVPGDPVRTFNVAGHFNYSWIFQKTGTLTVLPRVSDSVGGTNAIQVQIPDASAAATDVYINLREPPGTWTLTWDGKTTGQAANQTVKFGYNSLSVLATANLTSTWQTFSQTYNLTAEGNQNVMWVHGDYPSASSGARDFSIANIRITPGATASGNADTTAHPSFYGTGDIMVSGTALHATSATPNNGNAVAAKMATLSTLTTWAIMATLDATVVSGGGLGALVDSAIGNTALAQSLITDNGDTIGGGVIGNFTTHGGNWAGLGPVTFAMVNRGGSLIDVYINGLLVRKNMSATGTINNFAGIVFAGQASNSPIAGFLFQGDYYGAQFWNSAPTDAQIAAAHAINVSRMTAKGVSLTNIKNILIGEGDSITVGDSDIVGAVAGAGGGHTFRATTQVNASNGKRVPQALLAVNGSNFDAMNTRLPALLALISQYVAAGVTPIVTVLMMTNDDATLINQAACDSYYLSNLLPYYATVRTAGAKVIACTGIPNNRTAAYDGTVTATITPTTANAFGSLSGVTYSTYRVYLNALLMQHNADTVVYDGIADLASAIGFGTYAQSVANGVMTVDLVHPNSLGYHNMALKLAPVFSGLLTP